MGVNNGLKSILSLAVSIIYVLVPVSIYTYNTAKGNQTETLFMMLLVVFIIASGYRIYRDDMFSKALDEAKEMK